MTGSVVDVKRHQELEVLRGRVLEDELTLNTRTPSSSRPINVSTSLAIDPRCKKVRMKWALFRRVIRASMDSMVLESPNQYTDGPTSSVNEDVLYEALDMLSGGLLVQREYATA